VAGKQLRLSRDRALAVRQYMATRAQIDIKNLGIIPLKETPPTEWAARHGTAFASWCSMDGSRRFEPSQTKTTTGRSGASSATTSQH
jgi:hypothetical protein